MRVLVFTTADYAILSDLDDELSVEFDCESDDRRLLYIGLCDPEVIRADRPLKADMRWPVVGDRGEEVAYYIADRSRFIRFCEMFDLEYERIV